MTGIGLTLVVLAKGLTEVALLSLLGQGLLYVLCGAAREQNAVYKLFRLLASPAVRIARGLAGRFVSERRLPVVAFVLLLMLWVLLVVAKLSVCAARASACL